MTLDEFANALSRLLAELEASGWPEKSTHVFAAMAKGRAMQAAIADAIDAEEQP